MKKIIVILLATFLVLPLTNIQAKERVSKTKKLEIMEFDITLSKLPSNYKGVDYKKFMTIYTSKLKMLERNEFETKEELEKRTSDINSVIDPISLEKKYAFKLQDNALKYDADSESYSLPENGFTCKPYASIYMTCPIGFLESKNEEYRASNAYGAEVNVSKTTGIKFILSIPKDNQTFANIFIPITRYQTNEQQLNLKIPVEINKAKKIKNKKIGIVFVGTIVEAIKTKGSGYYSNATIDWPYATYVDEVGIPFNLEKVIVYLEETGEFLAEF